jgi:2-succinyl-5-enolpyruvyl-6-hydroxy-3-cyclohexene-1-carboxylate synthase
VVHALSIHDERGAGFRAVGFGRGSGHPAAVITSSGTAVANLYPAIIEAGADGVPLLVITADRPYESRDTGANQAIDQVKVFSSTYVRWFRDFLPPSDDVPVCVALGDAAHGVSLSRQLKGPVHLNIQFRENLAPDGGPIRNDDRVGSVTKYDGVRFTDSPAFQRWSLGGGQWLKSFSNTFDSGHSSVYSNAAAEIGQLITQSKRGIIVVGNLRKPGEESQGDDVSQTVKLLSGFAQAIGFPIFAGVQSGSLRFESPAVIPFAEHIMKCPLVQDNIKPDLVLQFGAPLISTEVSKIIAGTMSEDPVHHVLVHPHHPHERADPEFTVSHKVNGEIGSFLRQLTNYLDSVPRPRQSSNLAPLIHLGRLLQSQMPMIVDSAVQSISDELGDSVGMTEPEVMLSLSKILSDAGTPELSLFLSNSMPVRDGEAFLYPLSGNITNTSQKSALIDIGVNRGASGIDGIISSATGFADSTGRPTTLVIGDVAALHDINSLHALRTGMTPKEAQAQKIHPLTTIVLNNDGGGIFSFLPIAKHGSDVSFDEFFGTPTNTFSFEQGAKAFGLPFQRVENSESLLQVYAKSVRSTEPSIIEAIVAPRDKNVAIHREITKRANDFLADALGKGAFKHAEPEILHVKRFSRGDAKPPANDSKTLVLLHGWMGDREEWDDAAEILAQSLPSEWSIVSVDLPGHGESTSHLA